MIEGGKHAIETQVEEAAVQAGGLLRSRYSLWILAGLSFIESSLPIPLITDPFLVAYILADKKAVFKGVLVTTLSSVLGGLFAYAAAFMFYEFIIDQYITGSLGEQFFEIVDSFQKGAFWVTLAGAVTPIPYTLVALGAGFMKASVPVFIIASIIGRAGRYGFVGVLTYYFGDRALALAKRNLMIVTILFAVGAVLYFLLH